MTESTGLRVESFGALVLAAVFWFWFAGGLLSTGAQTPIVVGWSLVALAIAVLGSTFVLSVLAGAPRHVQVDAFSILGIVAMASFIGVLGAEAPVFYGPAFLTPLARLIFVSGLSGSLLAAILFTLLASRMHRFANGSIPWSLPGPRSPP
jgi:hypothetical protein